MKDSQDHSVNYERLLDKIQQLEKRVSVLEGETDIKRISKLQRVLDGNQDTSVSDSSLSSEYKENEVLESKIGEYGMAWLGNIVLLFGIIFFTQYLHNQGHSVISTLFGFGAVGMIYLTGQLSRKSVPYMSTLFFYNAHVLLFFVTLRLHFFPENQIIENEFVGMGIVLLVLISLIYFAIRKKSELLAGIVWTMVTITAIASNSTHFMLSLMVGLSGLSLYFTYKYGWWKVMIGSIILIYFTFLIWILGNPITGNTLEVRSTHDFGHIYLFTCALIYSMLGLLPKKEHTPLPFLNASILLNGLGFSFIFTFAVLSFFTDNYYLLFGLIAAFCIAFSIVLQYRGEWQLPAGMYALYSFVALSITIAGIFEFPLAYLLLSIQSLLVLSMALWFRSRFIVITNTLLFLGGLIAYLVSADSLNSINLSFALVALVSARVLNWKKKRLEIRTELIRNLYLFTGFIMTLYGLFHAFPSQYITLSWTLSALVFFVLSILIHNIKYRWLAITAMVVATIHLFMFDLSNMSIGYRIIALLFIATIALGISIFYTRRQKRKKTSS